MDSNPGLFGSETGDPAASCSVHFWPDELSVTVAIPDTLLNSPTYTPLPLPVWLIGAMPVRYDQLVDSPLSGAEVQPLESLPVLLSKNRAVTVAPCVLITYSIVSSGLSIRLLELMLAVDV